MKKIITLCLFLAISSNLFHFATESKAISMKRTEFYVSTDAYITKKEEKQMIAFVEQNIQDIKNGKQQNKSYLYDIRNIFPQIQNWEQIEILADALRRHFMKNKYADLHELHRNVFTYLNGKDDFAKLYCNPIKLSKIPSKSLSKNKARKQLKKLKISKKTNWKTACKKISKWICTTFRYDEKYTNEYNLNKIWKKKKTVCHGYASIFYAMAKECGLNVYYAETDNHAFNYIIQNGVKYYFDVTRARKEKIIKIKKKKSGVTFVIQKVKVTMDKSYICQKKYELSKNIRYWFFE